MISHNTTPVTSGLIFNYDISNKKSYSGPPIKNFLTEISPRGIFDNNGTYRVFSGTENVFIPDIGYINSCKYVDSYNDYNGGSGNCCPSLFGFGNGITLSGGTLYTYGILYRSVNRYTNPNFMYHYEYTSNGTWLTEFGVHYSNGSYGGSETHLGNGWYWSRAKFTTQATTSFINAGLWMYQYATWNRIYIAKAVLLEGDYTGLHPKYWPELNTTRTNTQTLTDLTGRSTITAGSLNYNSDGIFDFNYANPSYISVPLSTAFNKTEGTINLWVYPTRYNGGNGYFVNREDAIANTPDWFWIGPYSDNFYFRIGDGSTCCNNDLAFSPVSSVIPLNTWKNMCFTWKANGSSAIYINGSLYTSRSIGNIPNSNPASNGRFGFGHANADNYFHGKMPIAQIYNRQLTADEVKQNFNALRGRYGV